LAASLTAGLTLADLKACRPSANTGNPRDIP
jgi:hypothetical protein